MVVSTYPCKCAETMCQKMYCGCVSRGWLCSELCNCCNCKNLVVNKMVLKVVKHLSKRKSKPSAASRAPKY